MIVDLKLQFTNLSGRMSICFPGDMLMAVFAEISRENPVRKVAAEVIDLGYSKDSPIYLEIGGYHWFTGRMGTHKKNMAVKIDDVCYQAEQRSE